MFLQAVEEVLMSLTPLFEKQGDEDYLGAFSGTYFDLLRLVSCDSLLLFIE